MTRYERRTIPVDDGGFDVEGRIVEVLEAPRGGRNTITALVEVSGEETPAAPATFGDDSEGVDAVPSKAAGSSTGPITCADTKADGSPCTREVDLHGEKCWQHEEDGG